MDDRLSGGELAALVRRVFQPQPGEGDLAILVDLPDAKVPSAPPPCRASGRI